MAAPSIAELMQKAGIGFQEAADLISGGVGSNIDLRNWDAIMNSADPAAAARSGLRQMYTGNYNTSTRPDSVLGYSATSGNLGIGNGPNQDIYLLDSKGNALTQIGNKGLVVPNSRAGSTFGMDIGADMAALGLAGAPGGVGSTLEGNWLDAEGAMARWQASRAGAGYDEPPSQSPTGLASSAPSLQAYQKSPYLDAMAGDITSQVNNNLQRNILPNIRAESIAAGGYGDSRNAITDGLAVGETNRNLSGALANLYGTDYTNQMNRNLQQYGMDQSYSLGQTNADISRQLGLLNAENNRYSTDKSYDLGMTNAANSRALGMGNLELQQDQFGFNSALSLQNMLMGLNSAGLNAGTSIQNTPLNYWGQIGQGVNSIARGYGTQSGTQSGNPFAGAVGGWQLGTQIGNAWGGGQASNNNVFFGNGSMAD